ncbi:hypothetical protein A2U01_0020699, partial [Trifolium medium]|nr:hypothetical protein [Trifolium medium]
LEGCPEKKSADNQNHASESTRHSNGAGDTRTGEVAGPWVVVQKPRRQRRVVKDGSGRDGTAAGGARMTSTAQGPHHATRPPDREKEQGRTNVTNGPAQEVQSGLKPINIGDDMEIVNETPILDQQEKGANSMSLN